MKARHLLGVTTVRRRYTTLNGTLRFHWTGERTLSGRPTIFEHRWEDVLYRVNGEAHDFEGFGVPAWVRLGYRVGGGIADPAVWVLAWPCLSCGRLEARPGAHRCER